MEQIKYDNSDKEKDNSNKGYKNTNGIYSAAQLKEFYRSYFCPQGIKQIDIPKVY